MDRSILHAIGKTKSHYSIGRLRISLPESEFEIPGVPAIHCRSLGILEEIDAANEVKRRRALYHDSIETSEI